jgi:hypothetical protein
VGAGACVADDHAGACLATVTLAPAWLRSRGHLPISDLGGIPDDLNQPDRLLERRGSIQAVRKLEQHPEATAPQTSPVDR